MTVGQAAAARGTHANHQGRYGEGFVTTIALAAGFEVMRSISTGEGVDLTIYQPGRNALGTPVPSRTVFLQVKSCSQPIRGSDGSLRYSLKARAHDYLTMEHGTPHYLVVCVVPPSADAYLEARHDQLVCRHAAYWLSLRGESRVPHGDPAGSKVVTIPASNLLTPMTLRALVVGEEREAVVR